MKQLDAALLAASEKSNYLDIHPCHSVEIQRDCRCVAFYLKFQSIGMLRAQATAQAKNYLSPYGFFLDVHYHLRSVRRGPAKEVQ